jgi:hypothetical protein
VRQDIDSAGQLVRGSAIRAWLEHDTRVSPSRGPIDLPNQYLGAQNIQTVPATRRIDNPARRWNSLDILCAKILIRQVNWSAARRYARGWSTRRIDNTKYTISETKSSKLGASCKVQQGSRGRLFGFGYCIFCIVDPARRWNSLDILCAKILIRQVN